MIISMFSWGEWGQFPSLEFGWLIEQNDAAQEMKEHAIITYPPPLIGAYYCAFLLASFTIMMTVSIILPREKFWVRS